MKYYPALFFPPYMETWYDRVNCGTAIDSTFLSTELLSEARQTSFRVLVL